MFCSPSEPETMKKIYKNIGSQLLITKNSASCNILSFLLFLRHQESLFFLVNFSICMNLYTVPSGCNTSKRYASKLPVNYCKRKKETLIYVRKGFRGVKLMQVGTLLFIRLQNKLDFCRIHCEMWNSWFCSNFLRLLMNFLITIKIMLNFHA